MSANEKREEGCKKCKDLSLMKDFVEDGRGSEVSSECARILCDLLIEWNVKTNNPYYDRINIWRIEAAL